MTKTDANDGAGIANVLALPVSIVGIATAVFGFRGRPYENTRDVLASHARSLLKAVATAEARTLAQLLGDSGEPRPANVGFRQPPTAIVTWRTDRGAQSGSLETIHTYYRTLERGRLVVLGPAGSGKTVLSIRLLLDIAEEADRATPSSERTPVPVRLSLPAFISTSYRAADVRTDLEGWIADHLTVVHGVPASVAKAMLADGWILPVLDGLDEMDPTGNDNFRRARAVLRALNLPSGTRPIPVVLTCRADHYQDLTAASEDLAEALQDATAILVQPLSVSQVVSWLAHRFPDPTQPDSLQRRWRRVATTLRDHPQGRLANCLTSPLALYLAVTVYRNPSATPAELCDLDASSLRGHLFAQLIPAVTAAAEDSSYSAQSAERWLRTIANHLAVMGSSGGSSTDLHLHELWRTAGSRVTFWIRCVASGLAMSVGLAPAAALAIWFLADGDGPGPSIGDWALVAALLGAATVAFTRTYRGISSPLTRIDFARARTPQGQRQLLKDMGIGLAGGSAAAATSIVAGRFGWVEVRPLASDVAFGVGGGLIFGFLIAIPALATPRHAILRPSEPISESLRSILRLSLALGAVVGSAISLSTVLVIGSPYAVGIQIATGVVLALIFGSAITMLIIIISGAVRAWALLYAVTVAIQVIRGRLPRRPGVFLDWAYSMGLVRLAGTATQFRHRELQMHLTDADSRQGTAPSRPPLLRIPPDHRDLAAGGLD